MWMGFRLILPGGRTHVQPGTKFEPLRSLSIQTMLTQNTSTCRILVQTCLFVFVSRGQSVITPASPFPPFRGKKSHEMRTPETTSDVAKPAQRTQLQRLWSWSDGGLIALDIFKYEGFTHKM